MCEPLPKLLQCISEGQNKNVSSNVYTETKTERNCNNDDSTTGAGNCSLRNRNIFFLRISDKGPGQGRGTVSGNLAYNYTQYGKN